MQGVKNGFNSLAAKHVGVVATLISIRNWAIGIVVVGAVLALLAWLVPPPWDSLFVAVSKGYRFFFTHALQILIMPIHWIYDHLRPLVLNWFAKKVSQAAPVAAKP